MVNSQATIFAPRKFQMRAWTIAAAVGTAVALPILPLSFVGIPGPDFSDVTQVVTSSKNWLSRVTSSMDVVEDRDREKHKSAFGNGAEQLTMLEQATQQLRAQMQMAPADPALHNRLGLLYLSLGDTDKACENFQKAVSLSRLGIISINEKIAELRLQNRAGEAATSLLEASKLNVELSAAHSNLARVYEKRGEHDKVISELDLLNKEGVLFENASALAQSNGATMLNSQVARDLARAEALMQSRQYNLAADEYRRVLAQDNNIAMAHHRLGTILTLTGNPALAIDELEFAARLDAGSPEIQDTLGQAYQSMGLYPHAIKAFERALALEPRLTDAAINLSSIYSAQGRTVEATQILAHAISSNPNSAKAHNNLGTLFSMENKWGAALYEFQKAIALDPQLPSAHYGLGNAYLQTKSYAPAAREFKMAIALNPRFHEAQAKLDEANRKAGQLERLN